MRFFARTLASASASPSPERAAEEVASGSVGRASRPWLGWLALAMAVGLAVDTYAVHTMRLLPFDLPVALVVQRVGWGPLVAAMSVTNWVGGWWQFAVGLAAVAVMALVDRRAGWLMAIGSMASLLDNLYKLALARPRPSGSLVHVLNVVGGYSFPSGHAVFFTWLSFMAAFSLAPLVGRRLRPVLWAAAGCLMVTACLGRVWAGVHWPSDVLGGALLALGWSAFVLWLPERWIPQPSLRRLRARWPLR
jgi:membrane-associated phospholipid phosphatase